MQDDRVYEHPGVLVSQFSEQDLQTLLSAVKSMTPGQYSVSPVKIGHSPYLVNVKVSSGLEGQGPAWESIAAVLGWGPDLVEDHLAMVDESQRSNLLTRMANAATISWVGNNLGYLLEELIAIRKIMRQLDLIEVNQK
jgi:hypothetical protein